MNSSQKQTKHTSTLICVLISSKWNTIRCQIGLRRWQIINSSLSNCISFARCRKRNERQCYGELLCDIEHIDVGLLALIDLFTQPKIQNGTELFLSQRNHLVFAFSWYTCHRQVVRCHAPRESWYNLLSHIYHWGFARSQLELYVSYDGDFAFVRTWNLMFAVQCTKKIRFQNVIEARQLDQTNQTTRRRLDRCKKINQRWSRQINQQIDIDLSFFCL